MSEAQEPRIIACGLGKGKPIPPVEVSFLRVRDLPTEGIVFHNRRIDFAFG